MRSEAPRCTWIPRPPLADDALIYGAQWHHVALNFDEGAPALLLDGKPTRC